LTIITLFGGLASTVFIPLTTWLNFAFGWRTALLVLAGVLAIVTIAPHALLLRKRPEDIGEHIDGDAAEALGATPFSSEPAPTTSREEIARDVYRTRAFWLVTVAFALSGLTWSAMSVHLIAFELSRGMDAAFVASAAGAIGVMQVVGRLTLVPLTDRWSPRLLAILLMGLQTGAFLSLWLLPPTVGLLVYVVCFGVGFGTVTPVRAALIADVFGYGGYGAVSGMMGLVSNLTRAGAPVAVGALVGLTGYTPILIVLAGLCSISALLLTGFKPR
jgi:cyanate permease